MGYDILSLLGAAGKTAQSAQSPNQAQQALGVGQGVSAGAKAAGGLAGNSGLATLGTDLGLGLGAAGLGYGIYSTATDPNLSTRQKVGSAGLEGAEGVTLASPALAGALPALAPLATAAPYLGALLAAQAVSGQLEKSGSPQLRGIGKAIGGPLLPIEGLEGVITGKQSPRAAANATIAGIRDTPIIGKIASPILDAFGLGTKPTTGTLFRQTMDNLGKKLGLPKFDANLGPKSGKSYAQFMDLKQYNAFSPEARQAAEAMAAKMAPLSPYAKGKSQKDYEGQLSRALLGNYGNDITKYLPDVMAKFAPKPPTLAEQIKAATRSN